MTYGDTITITPAGTVWPHSCGGGGAGMRGAGSGGARCRVVCGAGLAAELAGRRGASGGAADQVRRYGARHSLRTWARGAAPGHQPRCTPRTHLDGRAREPRRAERPRAEHAQRLPYHGPQVRQPRHVGPREVAGLGVGGCGREAGGRELGCEAVLRGRVRGQRGEGPGDGVARGLKALGGGGRGWGAGGWGAWGAGARPGRVCSTAAPRSHQEPLNPTSTEPHSTPF